MREAAVAVFVILAGCTSTLSKAPITAEQMCTLDLPESWVKVPSAPDNAEQLVALADASPVFPKRSTPLPTVSWFRSGDGALLLCRHDNAGCVGEWWIYRSALGDWKIEKSDGWVCVT
jgi:hypothetical protein